MERRAGRPYLHHPTIEDFILNSNQTDIRWQECVFTTNQT